MVRQASQLEFDAIKSDVTQTFPRDHRWLELDARSNDNAEIDVTVDIDLQKVEEDPIARTMPHSNDAEMDDARARGGGAAEEDAAEGDDEGV